MSASSKDVSAMKDRIIQHMNKDHQDSLVDYLRFYASVPAREASTAQLVDISNDGMTCTVTRGGSSRSVVVPISPPMDSLMQARERLVAMAFEAMEGLGRSRWRVESYPMPSILGVFYGTVAATILTLALFPNEMLRPGAKARQIVLFDSENAARWFYTYQREIRSAIMGVAVYTAVMPMRRRLQKHSYKAGWGQWLTWFTTALFEGPAAYSFVTGGQFQLEIHFSKVPQLDLQRHVLICLKGVNIEPRPTLKHPKLPFKLVFPKGVILQLDGQIRDTFPVEPPSPPAVPSWFESQPLPPSSPVPSSPIPASSSPHRPSSPTSSTKRDPSPKQHAPPVYSSQKQLRTFTPVAHSYAPPPSSDSKPTATAKRLVQNNDHASILDIQQESTTQTKIVEQKDDEPEASSASGSKNRPKKKRRKGKKSLVPERNPALDMTAGCYSPLVARFNNAVVGTGYTDSFQWADEEHCFFFTPDDEELAYAARLADWWSALQELAKTKPDGVPTLMSQPKGRSLITLSEAKVDVFFNCVILYGLPPGDQCAEIFVTDYTINNLLFTRRPPEVGGTQDKTKVYGKRVLKVVLWGDTQIAHAQELETPGYYYIDNLRVRFDSKGYLEGTLQDNRRKIDKLRSDDPLLPALLQRRQEYIENPQPLDGAASQRGMGGRDANLHSAGDLLPPPALPMKRSEPKQGGPEITRLSFYNIVRTPIQKVFGHPACPEVFRIRARIVAFEPYKLENFSIVQVQSNPANQKACLHNLMLAMNAPTSTENM
ncbi:unnamed protein product [Rhizoctonia solani]|uniref:DUF2470 domain-containing protein n=1 Tax=Rhizoctonia solani TaxID=456999 RepID=A0A8H3APJ7_9AGAM|nr:unnamed protein product [Rhizoctonia solani]